MGGKRTETNQGLGMFSPGLSELVGAVYLLVKSRPDAELVGPRPPGVLVVVVLADPPEETPEGVDAAPPTACPEVAGAFCPVLP